MSLECDYIYGIAKADDVADIFKRYDLDENLSFCGEEIISEEIIDLSDGKVLTVEKMEKILECLGVNLRDENG